MNKFNHNFPYYDDDSDYTTNANSYYKYLGRKTKLIKLLAKRIWEYDDEINTYFERWENNLDSINEDVIDMMIQWLDDGTLDQIINEEIFQMKPDRSEMEDLFSKTTQIQTSEEVPQEENIEYWFEVLT